jgi:hypothetical protein
VQRAFQVNGQTQGLLQKLGFFATAGLFWAASACGTPKMPSGPPPEYEDPAPPSWMNKPAGSAAPAPAPSPAPAPAVDAGPPVT